MGIQSDSDYIVTGRVEIEPNRKSRSNIGNKHFRKVFFFLNFFISFFLYTVRGCRYAHLPQPKTNAVELPY